MGTVSGQSVDTSLYAVPDTPPAFSVALFTALSTCPDTSV